MFSELSFDELNSLLPNMRSEDYETYFDSMDIPEPDKEKRIELARDFESGFMPVFVLLFNMRKYDSFDWDKVRGRFETAYRDALGKHMPVSESTGTYIKSLSYDIVDSTQNHADEPYYYSMDRCRYISENEAQVSWNRNEFETAIESGYTMKQWVDVRDRRERKTHLEVGGTIKSINELFVVGNSLMNYPTDMTYSPELTEICGCRCSIRYF